MPSALLLHYLTNHGVSMKSNRQTMGEIILDNDIKNRFELIADQQKNHTAIRYQDKSVTYDELNQKANQLAHYILNHLLPVTDVNIRIGLRGSDKLEIIIAQLACVKIGAPYVVIDKDEATDRVLFMAKDAQLNAIINCDRDIAPLVLDDNSVSQLNIHHIQPDLRKEAKENLTLSFSPHSLAYVIYTSGSTGQPKGVMQSRVGLLGQMKYYSEGIGITDTDNILCISPLTHDQGMANVYSALLSGGSLFIHDIEQNQFSSVLRFIHENKITVYVSVPSVWKQIGGLGTKKQLASLRLVRLGGEETTVYHAQLYQEKCQDDAVFITAYGASECSFISLNKINKETDLSKLNKIPLGTLLGHVQYIVGSGDDIQFKVSSPYMALGYTNSSETDRAYEKKGEATFYKTGDIVQVSDNRLEFLGRVAWHVKIQGNRVNVHGIESIIKTALSHAGLECVVVAIGNDEDTRLVAYLTGNVAAKDRDNLLKELKSNPQFESYSVPHAIRYLDDFPKLHNKKIDRNAIKKIAEEEFLSTDELLFNTIKSTGDLAANMRQLWSLYLDLHDVNAMKDNQIEFVELGGNSTIAIALSNYINRVIDKSVLNLPKLKAANILTGMDFVKCGNLEEFKLMVVQRIEFYRKSQQVDKDGNPLQVVPISSRPYALRNLHAETNWGGGTERTLYPDIYSLSKVEFEGMQLLVEHVSRANHIKIKLCYTQDDFVRCVNDHIANNRHEESGFIFPCNDNSEAHRLPAILTYNATFKMWELFISDSFNTKQNSDQKEYLDAHMSREAKCQLRIYTDTQKRQKDEGSCNIDALLYIENAFNSGFRANVYIINSNNSFLSPPACMQASQYNIFEYISSLLLATGIDLNMAFNINCKLEKTDYRYLGEVNSILGVGFDDLLKKLIEYLKTSDPRLADLVEATVTSIRSNIKPYAAEIYQFGYRIQNRESLILDGIKSVTILGDQEILSQEIINSLSPYNIVLKRVEGGAQIYWRVADDGEGYHTKFWKTGKMPRLVTNMMKSSGEFPEPGKKLYPHHEEFIRYIQVIIRKDMRSYGKLISTEQIEMNAYYYQKTDEFYKIIMHGKELDYLRNSLNIYLTQLVASPNTNKLMVNGLLYLNALFLFDKPGLHTHLNMKMDSHDVIYKDARLLSIMHSFTKMLEGDFFFSHKNGFVEIPEIKTFEDMKSLIELFQNEYHYLSKQQPKSMSVAEPENISPMMDSINTRLQSYIAKLENGSTEGTTLFVDSNKADKLAAAKELQKVILGQADQSSLEAHLKALTQHTLKSIYQEYCSAQDSPAHQNTRKAPWG
jgi:acyl-coenzyme A synthetase/AMP-(fatty) acid ligase